MVCKLRRARFKTEGGSIRPHPSPRKFSDPFPSDYYRWRSTNAFTILEIEFLHFTTAPIDSAFLQVATVSAVFTPVFHDYPLSSSADRKEYPCYAKRSENHCTTHSPDFLMIATRL